METRFFQIHSKTAARRGQCYKKVRLQQYLKKAWSRNSENQTAKSAITFPEYAHFTVA